MVKHSARLARAEQEGYQRTLDELARRRGVLRWVIFASDAQPDPARPGEWTSDTLELLASLPDGLKARGMEVMGDAGEIVVKPYDEEPDEVGTPSARAGQALAG